MWKLRGLRGCEGVKVWKCERGEVEGVEEVWKLRE